MALITDLILQGTLETCTGGQMRMLRQVRPGFKSSTQILNVISSGAKSNTTGGSIFLSGTAGIIYHIARICATVFTGSTSHDSQEIIFTNGDDSELGRFIIPAGGGKEIFEFSSILDPAWAVSAAVDGEKACAVSLTGDLGTGYYYGAYGTMWQDA